MAFPATTQPPAPDGFSHEALLYEGTPGFLEHVTPFVREGRGAGEAVLVVVGVEKIAALRDELGRDVDGVRFADMADVGANPARIIPAWRQFLAEHAGTGSRVRGVGEPISPQRTRDEIVECQRHESLLNVAFAGTAPWWLLCTYDSSVLGAETIEEARRNHPFILESGTRSASPITRDLTTISGPFTDALPEPPMPASRVAFESADALSSIRDFVAERARQGGFGPTQTADLVVAVNEVVTNSLRHAGGRGVLRVWWDGDAMICEVIDDGAIADPMVGRELPGPERDDGRGLWIANQLCDLVQIRTTESGNVVRLHKRSGEGVG